MEDNSSSILCHHLLIGKLTKDESKGTPFNCETAEPWFFEPWFFVSYHVTKVESSKDTEDSWNHSFITGWIHAYFACINLYVLIHEEAVQIWYLFINPIPIPSLFIILSTILCIIHSKHYQWEILYFHIEFSYGNQMNHSRDNNKWELIDSNSNDTQMGTIHVEWFNGILPYIPLLMSISYKWGANDWMASSSAIPIPTPSIKLFIQLSVNT